MGKERYGVTTGYDYFACPAKSGSHQCAATFVVAGRRRGARYYDSWQGRWLQVDPLTAKYPGWSPYNYVEDNPLRLIDHNGKFPTEWLISAVAYVGYLIAKTKTDMENSWNYSFRSDKLTQGKIVNAKTLLYLRVNSAWGQRFDKAAKKTEKATTIVSLFSHTGQLLTTPAPTVSATFGGVGLASDVTNAGSQYMQGVIEKNNKKLAQATMSLILTGASVGATKAVENAVPESLPYIKNVTDAVTSNVNTGINIIIDNATKKKKN